jgi:hypothetical protein
MGQWPSVCDTGAIHGTDWSPAGLRRAALPCPRGAPVRIEIARDAPAGDRQEGAGALEQTQRKQMSLFPRPKPDNGSYALQARREIVRRPAPSQFDLIVTFANDEPAREALLALRREGFGPDQAVLLTPGPLAQDEFELASEVLRRESYLAFFIIAATEIITGMLLGASIGWVAGLFHFDPDIGPIWQPILIFGGIGLLCGVLVSVLDFRRWRRVHLPSPGQAAIALQLRRPDASTRLARAQAVLEQFGGQRELG